MSTEFLISLRYLFTKRKEKFLSLISLISILGVAIGVMALIVVIAVMTGFDNYLREKIVGNYSHITIQAFQPMAYSEYAAVAEKLQKNPQVKALSPYIGGQVLIEAEKKYLALSFKGIDPDKEKEVTKIGEYLVKGSLKDLSEDTVIIGEELALSLGLHLESTFLIYSPLGKKYNLRVVGIFNSGMYDYDVNLIIVNLATAQKILDLNNQISAIAVKLDDLELAQAVKKEFISTLGYDYQFKTWAEANQNFFAALKLEKLTMFIILTLIILVASFNIISTLIVMVVEKTKDIGILKAIGMSSAGVRNIFTYQGLLIGFGGTFLGAGSGIILCLLLKKYQFIKLPPDIYYIDRLPVALALWPDIVLIILAALAITLISTIYPATRAARLKPVEALRYE